MQVSKPSENVEDIWSTLDQNTYIHYIEDPITRMSYVVVHGEKVTEVVEEIEIEIPLWDHQSTLQRFTEAQTETDTIASLYLVALTAPVRQVAQSIEPFETAFSSDSDTIKHAAIVATGYVGWDSLRNLLQRLESNGSISVRRDATLMLEALRRNV